MRTIYIMEVILYSNVLYAYKIVILQQSVSDGKEQLF